MLFTKEIVLSITHVLTNYSPDTSICLLTNFPIFTHTKADDKADTEMALCCLKPVKHWAKYIYQYTTEKKKSFFIHRYLTTFYKAWKTETVFLVV